MHHTHIRDMSVHLSGMNIILYAAIIPTTHARLAFNRFAGSLEVQRVVHVCCTPAGQVLKLLNANDALELTSTYPNPQTN